MKLYIVATPIGNLGDMTYRAVDTLKNVDFIAAEDTRVTIKLLNHFDIQKPLVSYFEHNKIKRAGEIIEKIKSGQTCALVSDAGTPIISDPGDELVYLCRENGITVIPIPGACAVITALSASGITNGRFTFEGFLSTSKKSRQEHLESLKDESKTMVFYEAPHKLRATLSDFYKYFGDRQIILCRELTKIHEEFLSFTLCSAIEYYQETSPRGEFVLVLSGKKIEIVEENEEEIIKDSIHLVLKEEQNGLKLKDAVKTVSSSKNISKNRLYNAVISYKKDHSEFV